MIRQRPWFRLGAAGVLAVSAAASVWSCSSSDDAGAPGAGSDASLDASLDQQSDSAPGSRADADGPIDAAIERAQLDATCDARIVECTTVPTQVSPTVNDPAQCNAPAYDGYSTGMNNEQVEAACNAFCMQNNPSYADGGFVGCNQTPAEQSLGTGAFHCVCAP
jgi:hypothetical protein